MLKSLSTIFSSLLVVAVLMQPTPALAAEHNHEHAEPKKEAHDAMATGTKGVSTGTIISNQKGKLVLKTKEGNLLFMPHWRGGMPKDGGGLEKAMLEKMSQFKAGDHVKINWTWEERRRVEQIEKVEGKE